MAVTDEVVLLIVLVFINYLIIYRKNHFLGSMVFMVIGFGSILLIDGANFMWIGVTMGMLGLFSLFYDVIGRKT